MKNNEVLLVLKKSIIIATVEEQDVVKLTHIRLKDNKTFVHVVKLSDLKRVLTNEDVEVSSLKITKDDTRTLKICLSSVDELGKIALTGYCSIQKYVTFIEKLFYLINGKEIKSYPVSVGVVEYALNSADIDTILYLLKNGVVGQGIRKNTVYYKDVLDKTDGKPNRYTAFEITAKDEKYLCTISSGHVREDSFKEKSFYILDKPEEVDEKYFDGRSEMINFIGELCITK